MSDDCRICATPLKPVIEGPPGMWRCPTCRFHLGSCEYCEAPSMRHAPGTRVCLNPGCAVHGIHWVTCEHCRLLKVPLYAPEAPRVCVDLCYITLIKCCKICKGMVPQEIPFCFKAGCERAFRSGEPEVDLFEPLSPEMIHPASPPEIPAEPATPPPPDPLSELFENLHDRSLFDDRYLLLALIFRGGMGEILKVRDRLLGRDVAMKVTTLAEENPAGKAQLLKEARVGSRLIHPHILPVYDFGVDPQRQPFITMRLVEGASLRASLDAIETACRTGLVEFPLEKIVDVMIAACRAIHFAHGNGVVHLDLKPENILVSDFGEVFVIDWGLALVDGDSDLDQLVSLYRSSPPSAASSGAWHTLAFPAADGTLVAGTPGYMAPEQWKGTGLGPTTDVFGLGGILHYILHGTAPCRPWSEGWQPGVSDITRNGLAPALRPGLSTRVPGVPELLEICRAALAPDPGKRTASAEAMLEALVPASTSSRPSGNRDR